MKSQSTSARIFYCDQHGRQTEEDARSRGFCCDQMYRWFYRLSKFRAKRGNES